MEVCLYSRGKLMQTLQALVYIHFLCEALADKIFLLFASLWPFNSRGGAGHWLEQCGLCFCLSKVAELSSCS